MMNFKIKKKQSSIMYKNQKKNYKPCQHRKILQFYVDDFEAMERIRHNYVLNLNFWLIEGINTDSVLVLKTKKRNHVVKILSDI